MSDTFEAAEQALAAGLPADDGGSAPTDQPVGQPSVDENQPQPDVAASRDIDLSRLPAEARQFIEARERELQGDATRKWQEAAQLRQEAERSIQFIQALNTDPNFARQVHEHLGTSLGDAGYLQADISDDDFGAWDDDSDVDPYQAEIAELKQWREQVEEERVQQRIGANLDYQISQIRAQNPKWDQDDIGAVINYGFSTNGDLLKAAEMYKAHNERSISRYLEEKGSVTAPAQVPSTGGTPVVPEPKTDEELRQAALARIRAELG